MTTTTEESNYPKVIITGISRAVNDISLTWTNPTNENFNHIEISYTNGSISDTVSVSAGDQSYTISSLAGDCAISVIATYSEGNLSYPETILLSPGDKTYTIIRTPAEMNDVRQDLTAHYILLEDINLVEYAAGEGWEPIGDYSTFNSYIFTGTFNGNGHVLSNLMIDRNTSSYQGLFGYLGTMGTLEYLGLNADVIGLSITGGLVGLNQGTVSNSYSSNNVNEGGINTGGLVGFNYGGTVEYSYSMGQVVGANCGTSTMAGGLVSTNSGTISNCYSMCSVESQYTGGLVETNSGTVEYSYAAGLVYGCSSPGGLVRVNTGTDTACYWDTEATEQSSSAGGTGKTTIEMQDVDTYTTTDPWDFVLDPIWAINVSINNGYPYLSNNPPAE